MGRKKDKGESIERSLAKVESSSNSLVVLDEQLFQPATDLIFTSPLGHDITIRRRKIKINDQEYEIDPQILIRMIRHVTQVIGEYKDRDVPFSAYIISAMRKARADMVADLETNYHIYWRINKETGESVFYLGSEQ